MKINPIQLLSHLAPLFGLLSFACEVSNQINIEKKELGLKKELGILNLSFSIDNCKNLHTTYVGFGFSILVHKQQSICVVTNSHLPQTWTLSI